MSLGIADLWEVLKHKKSDNPKASAPLLCFLENLLELDDLSIKEPKVWLSIMAGMGDDARATAFIETHFID
jgi:hypothetical protein